MQDMSLNLSPQVNGFSPLSIRRPADFLCSSIINAIAKAILKITAVIFYSNGGKHYFKIRRYWS